MAYNHMQMHPNIHTHILNFSITENNILAFFDCGSTQGKEKIRTVTLILIVKLWLQDGKKVLVFFSPPPK